jgi:hypothetical protein
MFSGRIGFVAFQQGLGLLGQRGATYENDDLKAAAEAALMKEGAAEPAKPARRPSLLMNLIAALF